jgi:Tfp pilus assembly protein PilZ
MGKSSLQQKRNPIMADNVDQLEKQTILARLSASIYQMTGNQLEALHNLLEEDSAEGAKHMASVAERSNAAMRRQMIVARLFVLINRMDKDALLKRLKSINHPSFQWVREYPRLSCYLSVDFATGGKAYRSCIRDISANGVFIETAENFEIGQNIALCFTLIESEESLPFKVQGKVTQIYPDGIGVQYQNMTGYQRAILNTLIEQK